MATTITQVTGQAWVREADGSLIPLRAGMQVPANAEIVTADGASVQMQTDGLPAVSIGGGREVQLGAQTAQPVVDPFASAAGVPTDADAARVLAALQAGEDPFAVLDATAAVVSGAGGDDGGSSFTRIAAIIETTNPLGLEYPRPGLSSIENVQLGGASAADDGAGGPTGDVIPPSMEATINSDGTVTFQFTEEPFGFELNDIVVDNGVISNLVQDPTDPTRWTADLTPEEGFEGDVTVTVPDGSYTDEDGNLGFGDSDSVTVDTLAPTVSVELEDAGAGGAYNGEQITDGVKATVTLGAGTQVGDTLVVVDGKGNELFNGPVTADMLVDGLDVIITDLNDADSTVSVTATVTDPAGNTDSDQADGVIDAIAPEAEIEINTIAGDDVINAKEAEGDVAVSGTVGLDVKEGDTVTVTVGGIEYTTQVQADNTWSVNVPGSELAENSRVDASVTTKDAAGNEATAEDDRSYGVQTDLPTAEIEITEPLFGTDNVINREESTQA
ncbi:MAG: retention module-containing protein, partial [Alcaligenaceae bacterium]|nr:retention module-containing protein [Alcaligenaceae bacterium]